MLKMIVSVWTVFFVSFLATTAMSKAGKAVCSQKFLRLKNCMVSRGAYKVQFTKEKILVNSGVWRNVHSQPVVSEGSSWKSIAIKRMGTRYLLEQLVWDAADGEAGIQSLHWIVWELQKADIIERIHKVVQKRNSSDVKSRKSYTYDPAKKYGIKLGQHNKILWRIKADKGSF